MAGNRDRAHRNVTRRMSRRLQEAAQPPPAAAGAGGQGPAALDSELRAAARHLADLLGSTSGSAPANGRGSGFVRRVWPKPRICSKFFSSIACLLHCDSCKSPRSRRAWLRRVCTSLSVTRHAGSQSGAKELWQSMTAALRGLVKRLRVAEHDDSWADMFSHLDADEDGHLAGTPPSTGPISRKNTRENGTFSRTFLTRGP